MLLQIKMIWSKINYQYWHQTTINNKHLTMDSAIVQFPIQSNPPLYWHTLYTLSHQPCYHVQTIVEVRNKIIICIFPAIEQEKIRNVSQLYCSVPHMHMMVKPCLLGTLFPLVTVCILTGLNSHVVQNCEAKKCFHFFLVQKK